MAVRMLRSYRAPRKRQLFAVSTKESGPLPEEKQALGKAKHDEQDAATQCLAAMPQMPRPTQKPAESKAPGKAQCL